MGFFGGSKKISSLEFKKVRSALYNAGFSTNERNKIESIFRADLYESGAQAGIDSEELKKGIKWMEDHKFQHGISLDKIQKLKTELEKYL